MLIDTHCHLYDEQFDTDRREIISRAQSLGIGKILMPNCDSRTIKPMLQTEKEYPGICFPMMGLHPCYVKENFEEELEIVKQWLEKRTFLAVGEIGLDFYWDKTYIREQETALHRQIEWALEKKLPVVLHTRESIDETIQIVKKYVHQGLTGVFHCFSGNETQAKIITEELGFFLGIGGVLTFKNSKLKDSIRNIDIHKILPETDAPYLAPAPHRGIRNEPSYIKIIYDFLGGIYETDQLALILQQNTHTLFHTLGSL